MVYLIRSNDIYSDPRAMKYVQYLRKTRQDFKLMGWDRDNKEETSPVFFYYKRKAGYNVGGMKAAFNRIGWMWYVVWQLRKMPKDDLFLHCCDLDAAFPAAVYKKFFNHRAFILFDVFDWFSAAMSNQNIIIRKAFLWMERISMKWTDHFFICEPEREDQFPCKVDHNKLSILPNIPNFDNETFLTKKSCWAFNNDLPVFSYVGYFSNERCLEEIIALASEGVVNLLIAGYGADSIENHLNQLSGSPFIKYFGKVKYTDGLNLMYNSDIVYAMYSKVIPNHVYAAPNKYYESMFLRKPIFTTKGTIVGDKVIKNGTGYVSEESKEDIFEAINQINHVDMVAKGEHAHKLWAEKYSNYTEDFLGTTYEQLIRTVKLNG